MSASLSVASLMGQAARHVESGRVHSNSARATRVLSSGFPELDALLPDGGFRGGEVLELCSVASGRSTSIGLSLCHVAQKLGAQQFSEDIPWCAFIDPSRTLYAPAVARANVTLERLLVVQPSLEVLDRVALKIVESQAFRVVVVDTVLRDARSFASVSLGKWGRIIRRFSMALENTQNLVVLLTEQSAHRPLPLPVSMRLELTPLAGQRAEVRVAKEKRGRITMARTISLSTTPDSTADSTHAQPVVSPGRGQPAVPSTIPSSAPSGSPLQLTCF